MKSQLKHLWVMVSIMGIALSACHDGDKSSNNSGTNTVSSSFSTGCSGSFSEQLECYANKYLNDKTEMEDTESKCKIDRNFDPVKCRAVRMVKYASKTIKWLNKPEPYPNRSAKFFRNTSDQIRIDEDGWCIAKTYSDSMFDSSDVESCVNLIDKLGDGTQKVKDESDRMIQAYK